ncbi:MAG: M20/M25/M40 family metallo-hydrolase, partial [Clostridium sp.]|nr:M20/M25/M40 family metallo-hydrolase [Clostridium sp.]
VDAVVVAAATVMNLQTIVSREYAPLDPLVISVGSIHSGDAFNVISGEATLDGTVRYFKKAIGDNILDSISKVIKSTASLYGASSELEYFKYIPPLYNDEGASLIARHAAIKVLGEENIVTMEKTTGGEDFAYYLEHKPGCFAFLGSKNTKKKTDAAHHNDHFDIDEDVLINGSLLHATYALNFLHMDQ